MLQSLRYAPPRQQAQPLKADSQKAGSQREGIQWINPEDAEKALHLYVDKNLPEAPYVNTQITAITRSIHRLKDLKDGLLGEITSSLDELESRHQTLTINIKNELGTPEYLQTIEALPQSWSDNPSVSSRLESLESSAKKRAAFFDSKNLIKNAFTSEADSNGKSLESKK